MHGDRSHVRKYLVLLQNEISAASLQSLREGVAIKIAGGQDYVARPVAVELVNDAKRIYPFAADHREQFPHTWLLITLTEGKFRQVRKMVLSVRHRCLRLIRVAIDDILITDLAPGEVKELDKELFMQQTRLVL